MPHPRRRAAPVLNRHRRPEGMSVEDWQRQLRLDFGRAQRFRCEPIDGETVPADVRVINPERGTSYVVSLRGPGADRCTCPDFRVSGLDLCKHIAFARKRLENKIGRRAVRQLNAAPPVPTFSEVTLSRNAERRAQCRLGTAAPAAFLTLVRRLCAAEGVLGADHALSKLVAAAHKLGHELRVDDLVREAEAARQDGVRRCERIDQLFPRGAKDAGFTRLLREPLLPYQREGAWRAARAGRALIADEMGLGKTVQAIAVRAILERAGLVQRTLVICPASLVHQWGSELQRFAKIQAQPVTGTVTQRQLLWADLGPHLKLCTYDAVHRDLKEIRAWDPDLLILDEAQRIKNWPTRAARAVKQLEAAHVVVLTGTPLENKLEELHSLVEVLDPHLLGPLYRFKHNHEKRDEGGKVVGYTGLDLIAESLAGVLIRRTKAQVLTQLPGRSDRTICVPLGPEQRRHHDEGAETVSKLVKRWRRRGFLLEEEQRILTATLTRMRMVCDSTYLVNPQQDEGAKVGEIMTQLEEWFASSPDGKVVIFSAWRRMHELLVRACEQRAWGHVLFHGEVPVGKRGALVERFISDPTCRLFLSTDAGGVGLNLQCASLVVNVDLPWNPAVLEQRISRIHRMGQKRPVQVINMVADNSIESGILTGLAFKRAMAAGVLDHGDAEIDLGGSRLKLFMDEVERVTDGLRPVTVTDVEAEPEPEVSMVAAVVPPPVSASHQATREPITDRQHEQSPAAATIELLTGAGQAIAGLAKLFTTAEIRRDANGQEHLHLPLPDPARLAAVRHALAALAALG